MRSETAPRHSTSHAQYTQDEATSTPQAMSEMDVNLMESPPDKVVLVGDVGVGKTSMFVRFKTGQFSENASHNPREGETRKTWLINGKEVSVSCHMT